jgi:phenylacetic acid degradation operon negative regulatory protein
MGKLLRVRDILLLTFAGVGDIAEEVKDPMQIMGKSYEAMYGFIPKRYKRSNFLQTVSRSLRTGDIEKVLKNGDVYLRLTSTGTKRVHRDFPILSLTRKWDKRWVIVVFDISEKSKSVRNNFRNKLKSLGFGMLQESVWISPLAIGEDMREFIDSIGLSQNVFVMEVSGFILGDPKQLARSIWGLDRLEKEYVSLEEKVKHLNQLVKQESDRINKSEAKTSKNNMKDYVNELLKKKREIMRERLEFIANFPPLPHELLPKSLQNISFALSKL